MSESEMITEDTTLTLTRLNKCGLHQVRRSVERVSAIQTLRDASPLLHGWPVRHMFPLNSQGGA
jgi:predicted metalloprotease